MKKLSLLLSMIIIFSMNSIAQEDNSKKDRDWLIETEPGAFILKGFHINVGRNITKDNKLNLSLFGMATDVPQTLKERMFTNTVASDNLRLGFQISANIRYKIEIFKEKESNPYVGVIAGWEYFNLTNSLKQDLRTDVYVLTPYVGHLIYFYKQMLYVNPQLRGVIYIDPTYSDASRPEKLNDFLLLPQISVGIRL